MEDGYRNRPARRWAAAATAVAIGLSGMSEGWALPSPADVAPGGAALKVALTIPGLQQDDPATPSMPYMLAFSDSYTQVIVRSLGEVERECGSVAAEYRIDCLGQGFKWASTRVSNPDYAGANSILRKAGSQLTGVASRNVDSGKEQLQADTSDNAAWKNRRRYRPVKLASLFAANQAARAIITEAATQLLRASENSEKRRVHYGKIAAAVDSTKRLLRSS